MAADAHARFVALVRRPEPEIPLGEAALALAGAVVRPSLDVDAALARLRDLASGLAPAGDPFGALARYLFDDLGFAGDTDDYGAPANSDLDAVMTRRRGLPITLSVLMIDVGARAGVPVVGVGLPGHFLVASGTDRDRFCDPFHGGVELDAAGVRDLHARMFANAAPLDPSYLEPTPTRAILARMARNLLQSGTQRSDPALAARAARALLAMPDVDPDEARRLLAYLGAVARTN